MNLAGGIVYNSIVWRCVSGGGTSYLVQFLWIRCFQLNFHPTNDFPSILYNLYFPVVSKKIPLRVGKEFRFEFVLIS